MNLADRVSVISWVSWTGIATLVFWACFGACVEAPAADVPPQARVIVSWDPARCGEPHRVVVELEDEGGAPVRGSTPCERGGLTLDLWHFGVWHAQISTWTAEDSERSVLALTLAVDEPVVRWLVETPR
jgi:hypothetical protein